MVTTRRITILCRIRHDAGPYAGLHVLSHDKPSYFYYTRSRTFDPDKFPPHVKVTTAADRTSDATEAEKDAMCREMKRRV